MVARWIKPADSPSATGSLAAISPLMPRGPRRPWDRGPLYKEGTLASEGMQSLGAKVLASNEMHRTPWQAGGLGTMPPAPIGAIGTLGPEATRDRFGPGTKVVDEMKVPSRRRSHQGKGPRWSMRWRRRVAGGSLSARAPWYRGDLDRLMPGSVGTEVHREAWSSMSRWTLAPRCQGWAIEGSWHRGDWSGLVPGGPSRRWTRVSRWPWIEEPCVPGAAWSRGLQGPCYRVDEDDLGRMEPG